MRLGSPLSIGIIALLHESNTFSQQPTILESFQQNTLLEGDAVREALAAAPHEVGGFFCGLEELGCTAVPLFAARALPSGTVTDEAFSELVRRMLAAVEAAGPLDGLLVAPHGATVSARCPDADGDWLHQLRQAVGPDMPIIGTLDAHANLSPLMVASCDALIGYRTNPHLDQHARGVEAARLMVRTVRKEVRPTMAACFPPMAIGIERQCTSESPLQELCRLADHQRDLPGVLTNSLLLGFPYADVPEMGSSVIVVTDNDLPRAEALANELAGQVWEVRHQLVGDFVTAAEALARCQQVPAPSRREPVCLLDMGDNVGGGSAADGTELLIAIKQSDLRSAFVCLFDPEAVRLCESAGVGARLSLRVGGKSDTLHGPPVELEVHVAGLHEGRFRESKPTHGGMQEFDQGRTAVCTTDDGLTLMLTSLRMVPFSLEQLHSCGLRPGDFRLLVAKGVNAPLAAYSSVCPSFIRVNTGGSTCAQMTQLTYQHRRRPLYPFEQDTVWSPGDAGL